MTSLEVAQALKAIKRIELACVESTFQNIADAIVTIDATSASSPYPSANKNGVYFLGCEAEVSKTDIASIVRVFEQAGVERFFLHLCPTPQQDVITKWLAESGFEPFFGPQYPTLVRSVQPVPPAQTRLRIARVESKEIELHKAAIAGIFDPWPTSFFIDSQGQDGVDHFLAYDGDVPVSAGLLMTLGKFAYLGWAATAESHRGQGGQNALIRARLNRAAELGCQVACSETLTILESSLRNLQRNGFEWLYEKQVFCYECNR